MKKVIVPNRRIDLVGECTEEGYNRYPVIAVEYEYSDNDDDDNDDEITRLLAMWPGGSCSMIPVVKLEDYSFIGLEFDGVKKSDDYWDEEWDNYYARMEEKDKKRKVIVEKEEGMMSEKTT